MTPAEIDALSGYNNASTGRHRIACNGSMIAGGGFKLDASTGSQTYNFPDGWNGGFFPRTGCTFDANGIGSCDTGNCIDGLNRGLLQCGGAGSASPVTKAEMNFGNTWVDVDNYDVSFVNGFNVAMVFTPTQYNATYIGRNQCTSGGCAVNLSSFSSPKVPSWNMLKYTSVSNFIGIYDSGDYFYNTHYMAGDPHTGPNAANWTIFYGYSCPISEGYVNNSAISCADVPPGKTCKTCAGQNTNLYPFNLPGALPDSANLFFDTCPNAYAYTYNDTAALMTCNGQNAATETNYTITMSCQGGTAAPTITSIKPGSGENTTTVSISNLAGTGFYGTPTVSLSRTGYSNIPATGVTVVSANKITCNLNLANQIAGAWNVNVINPDGQQASLSRGFAITNASTPAPTVVNITPGSGANTGTVSITNLAGTGFYGTPTVSLSRTGYSDIPATGVTVVSANKITCNFNLADQVIGSWNVNVMNPDGQQATLSKGFVITNPSAPAPTVTGITPSSGQNTTTVSITNLAGTGFYGIPTVSLSRTGYSDIPTTGVTVVSANKITCNFNLVNQLPGSWNVNVINPDGQEATLSKGFTITNPSAPAPTVTSITPSSGMNTGSVSITTLAGTGFYGTPTVSLSRTGYGSIPATGVTVVSASNITCNFNLADQASGSWNVNVINPDEQEATLSNGFAITSPVPTTPPTPAPDSGDTGGKGGSSSGYTVATAPAAGAGQTLTFTFNQQPTLSKEVAASQVQIITGAPTESFAVIAQPVTVGNAIQITGQPVAGYLEISPVGVPSGSISQGIITFTVDGVWLTTNNLAPGNVVLMRYHDQQWSPLPTTFVSVSNGIYTFTSTTPGFSYFAVTADKQKSLAATTPSPGATANTTLAAITTGAGTSSSVTATTTKLVSSAMATATTVAPAVTPAPATTSGFPLGLLGIAVVIVVIIAVAAILIHRWWIRRQNPMLFRKYD
ncbi:thaumatin family protein [Methanoregula sp.]|uniref:thaumatin family protein n=1 Tax=Methanoregula sp. TaxID=2052170 RepID=UPI003562D809